jgi:hypothetical protein
MIPFRLWFYLAKVGGTILLAAIFFTFTAPKDSVRGHVHDVAVCLLIPLCLTGAFLGMLFAFGKLRMRCPFCGKSGKVGGSKGKGMWMVCESCGFIHSAGLLGLKIVKDEKGK